MNYVEFHLGDYMRDTAHLSMLEDAAYRRLLDAYYIRERALPADLPECCKLARASSKPEREAVTYVLKKFFQQTEDGYHQRRADDEIARYGAKRRKAQCSAEARWACERNANALKTHVPNGAAGDANVLPTQSEGNPLQTPGSNPQSPVPNLQSSEIEHGGLNGHPREGKPRRKGSNRVPPEFAPDREFALAELPDADVETEIAKFRDWEFKTPRSDWPAVWRTWIRNAKASGKYARKSGKGATDPVLLAWEAVLAGHPRDARTQRAVDRVGGFGRIQGRRAFEDAKVRAEFCDAWRESGPGNPGESHAPSLTG